MSMNPKSDNLAKSQELKNQIATFQHKKQQLQNETQRRASWEQRKARTKRLIETGALAEKYFEMEDFTIEQREKIFQTFSEFVKNKIHKRQASLPEYSFRWQKSKNTETGRSSSCTELPLVSVFLSSVFCLSTRSAVKKKTGIQRLFPQDYSL